MKKLSKEKKMQLTLVALATAGIIAGLWICLLSPERSKIKEIEGKIASTKQRITKMQKVVVEAALVQTNLDEATAKLNAIETTMPSGDLYSWMVSTLRQFNASGYRVDMPQIGMPAIGEVRMFSAFPYHQATVSVAGSAYYWDFGRFLADFENHFPYMQVEDLNIEPAAGMNPEERERLSFHMNIVALVKTNPL
jgi:Tfp pilus assembly protein PilO